MTREEKIEALMAKFGPDRQMAELHLAREEGLEVDGHLAQWDEEEGAFVYTDEDGEKIMVVV